MLKPNQNNMTPPNSVPFTYTPAPSIPPPFTYTPAGAGGESSSTVTCPKCQSQVKMRAKYHATNKTYCVTGLFCLLLLWPCLCLPFFFQWGYKFSKFCPNCKTRVGEL
ncbi:hypothetical protein KR215_004107 [Drosophila sulfurigaster]|nr:hypothetical protein KR215_004107 [Drosophila sulfurigaster]